MLSYWTDIAKDVANDKQAVILQFADSTEQEVIGYVCLLMPVTETGPFRGEVLKLMVSPDHRRKGVARRVMQKLEDVARGRERWLLVCIVSCSVIGVRMTADKSSDTGYNYWATG
jgi:ribosomal protein S18 acetylase RimI-like enzyme